MIRQRTHVKLTNFDKHYSKGKKTKLPKDDSKKWLVINAMLNDFFQIKNHTITKLNIEWENGYEVIVHVGGLDEHCKCDNCVKIMDKFSNDDLR